MSHQLGGRLALLLGATAMAVLALAPAALASKTSTLHVLKTYKKSSQHTLTPGQTTGPPAIKLGCDSGDLAVDGMWLVDGVDQHNPQLHGPTPFGEYDGVDALAALSNPSDASEYLFILRNNTPVNAQVKLFVTCLGKDTHNAAPGNHKHSLQPTTHHAQIFSSPPNHELIEKLECPAGWVAVAPGFDHWNGTLSKPFHSWPYTEGNLRGWEWGFWAQGAGADVQLSIRCLRRKLTKVDGHSHFLRLKFRKSVIQLAEGMNRPKVDCGKKEKGLVGAFNLWQPGFTHPYGGHHRWYLGMEPEIKSRRFKVQAPHLHHEKDDFGVLCVNDRTGKRVS